MLNDLHRKYDRRNQLDIILVTGDSIVHGLANGGGSWTSMKEIFTTEIERLNSKFPGVPILPAIGNNDVMTHY